MEIEKNFTFVRTYEIELKNELDNKDRLYFPEGKEKEGGDGLIISVIPSSGNSWIGIFSFGDIVPNGMCGIYSMPDEDKLCIVSKGKGYIVSSSDPRKWEEVEAIPVTGVECIKKEGVILFADYTRLVAYDSKGLRWKSEKLAYDCFKIIHVYNNVLTGEFWDIRKDSEEIFEINIKNGSIIKGGDIGF